MVYASTDDKQSLPIVDITWVEASVTTSLILTPFLIKVSVDFLKSLSLHIGWFYSTSRLSTVSISTILLVSESIWL